MEETQYNSWYLLGFLIRTLRCVIFMIMIFIAIKLMFCRYNPFYFDNLFVKLPSTPKDCKIEFNLRANAGITCFCRCIFETSPKMMRKVTDHTVGRSEMNSLQPCSLGCVRLRLVALVGVSPGLSLFFFVCRHATRLTGPECLLRQLWDQIRRRGWRKPARHEIFRGQEIRWRQEGYQIHY